jgi:hypothetical protein
VGDNELNLINNLANQVVENAVANGLMQHPDIPQDSRSINSGSTTFFRAQGVPVTLELPLPSNGDVSRTTNLPQLTGIEFDSDFLIRQMADRIGLHPGLGPRPSADMLIRELTERASFLQAMLPMKTPLEAHEWNSFPQSWFVPGNWFFNVNNPKWGNNAEASSSTGVRVPRLQLLGPVHFELHPSSSGTDFHNTHQVIEDNEEANLGTNQQLQLSTDEHLASLGQALQVDPQHNAAKTSQPTSEIGASRLNNEPLIESITRQKDSVGANSSWDLPLDSAPSMSTPSPQHHKRKPRAKTPVVEDEVRMSARLRRNSDAIHIQLENEPRRRKGAARKTVRFSKVEELKSAIITRKIEHHDTEDWEIKDITAPLLVELGTGFC